MKKIILSFLTAFLLFITVGISANAAENNTFLIINKYSNKMALFEKGKKTREFKVATGRDISFTPEGTFTITKKIVKPIYYRTNIKGGDPRNPLGPRWMGFDARGTNGDTYGIHGTNIESSIGTYASGGCIRMYNKEAIWLYDHIPYKTKVVIVRSSQSFDYIAKSKNLFTNKKATEKYYTVIKGDMLYKISKKYHLSVSDLKKINNLKSDKINVGQKLIVKK